MRNEINIRKTLENADDNTTVKNIGEVKYMNKRIKKKVKHWSYTTAKTRKRNKALCERYPFLIPRYYFANEIYWTKKKKH